MRFTFFSLMFIAAVMVASTVADRKASQGKVPSKNNVEGENPEHCCAGLPGAEPSEVINDRGSGVPI